MTCREPEWRPLGTWVVIEPVRSMVYGGIAAPLGWAPAVADAGTGAQGVISYTVGKVLALGPDVFLLPSGARLPPPFEVGDWLLVENFVGHPGMAGEEPGRLREDGLRLPGRTHVVDLDCSVFGGTVGKQAAIVPFLALGLPLVTDDEEAERRELRIKEIEAFEHTRKSTLDGKPDHWNLVERANHQLWLDWHAYNRQWKRRSRRLHPTGDPGRGEGVLAVLEDLDAVLACGADPVEVAEMLGMGPADNGHGPDEDEDDDDSWNGPEFEEEEAMDVAEWKTCPRCGRVGAVSPQEDAPDHFVILWPSRPESTEWEARGVDRDTLVTRADLADPIFGCGFDNPAS